MESSSCYETPYILYVFVVFLLFSPTFSSMDFREENRTSMTGYEAKKMKLINSRLKKTNKPFVKSIKSPDGDIIDCILFHLQPSLNRPGLKEKLTLIPPELPKGYDYEGSPEIKQLWNSKGESCPNGTIPIRRASPSDIFRSISSSKSGKKYSGKDIPVHSNHEHALGYVNEGEFYGTRALLNVWEPNVTRYDFSLSQIWVLTDIPGVPANSVEAGWHVSPNNHKDSLPRLFTYWTPDGYKSGCYNTDCPGFVQTSQKFCLGAAIDPISTYNGQQYDVEFIIWKDIKSKNWWLRVAGELIGFWPKELFKNLQDHATLIEYGGEVFSHDLSGRHTSTQMGSGHFPDEGFGKAAYIRNLEVVDQNNYLNDVTNLKLFPEKPNCYSVTSGYSDSWRNYIYFGGPGYSPNCL